MSIVSARPAPTSTPHLFMQKVAVPPSKAFVFTLLFTCGQTLKVNSASPARSTAKFCPLRADRPASRGLVSGPVRGVYFGDVPSHDTRFADLSRGSDRSVHQPRMSGCFELPFLFLFLHRLSKHSSMFSFFFKGRALFWLRVIWKS